MTHDDDPDPLAARRWEVVRALAVGGVLLGACLIVTAALGTAHHYPSALVLALGLVVLIVAIAALVLHAARRPS